MPVKHVWKRRRHPTTTQRPTTTTSLVASVRKYATPSSLERCGSPEWTTKKTPSNDDDVVDALASNVMKSTPTRTSSQRKSKATISQTMAEDADAYVMKSTPARTRKSKATISQTMAEAEDADVGDEVGDENENGDGNDDENENGDGNGDGGVTGNGGVDGNGDVDNTDNNSLTNTTAATTSPTSKIQTVSNLCMYVIGAYLYI